MNNLPSLRPTLAQRLFSHLGRTRLPKLEGLYRRLGVFSEQQPREFECEFDGLRYQGRLDQRIDQQVYFFGSYSPAELDFLAQAACILSGTRHNLSFLDIGANVGQHTLFMSKRVSTVLAFEPGLEAASQLESNLRLNGIQNVKLARIALGKETGIAELGSGFAGNNGSRSLNWSLDTSKNTVVPIRSGDDVLPEYGISKVDIIKMDVEGHEKEVLVGIAHTLLKDRPVMLFELVGEAVKGGFHSEAELRSHLYPDHILYTLTGARKAQLAPFAWDSEEAVCIPAELAPAFRSLTL